MYFFLAKRVSHKKWRCFVKAERRRKKRSVLASYRDAREERQLRELLCDHVYHSDIEEQNFLQEEAGRLEELAARKRREEWVARDLALHAAWRRNKEKEDKVLQEQQRKEDELKKEWEENVRKEEEEKAKKKEQQVRPTARNVIESIYYYITHSFGSVCLQETLLRNATINLGTEETRNPDAPPGCSRIYKEKEIEPCPFFYKTGACRFGADCSREHKYPSESRTVLLANMYSHLGLMGDLTDDYDMDLSLEYTTSERNSHFREFYMDVFPEFAKCGQVVQFKVCCNKSAHLRGNVYVQYKDIESAKVAARTFNGRWYAGKQISCIFIPIERWNAAICGQHFARRCPKGDMCNFLHVFRNPGNSFHWADKDNYPTKDSARNGVNEGSYRRERRKRSTSRWRRSRSRSRSTNDRSSKRSRSRSRSSNDRSSRDRSIRRQRNRRRTSSRRSRNNSSDQERSRSRRKRSSDRDKRSQREKSRSSSSERNKENKKSDRKRRQRES